MQNIRQMLEAMEVGVSFDSIYMQLVEGVNKSTANTIGIEIEMAIDEEESANIGFNERQLFILNLQWNRLVALQKALAKDMQDLNAKVNEWVDALRENQFLEYAKELLKILSELLDDTNVFDNVIEEVQSIDEEGIADNIIQMLDGSGSISSDALNFHGQVEDIITTLQEHDLDDDENDPVNTVKELELVVKRLSNRYHCSLHLFNDSLKVNTEIDGQLHSLMHPEPEESANAWQEFRDAFSAIGWEVKDDPSIKPYGLEAVTQDGGFAITDFAKIKKGFEVAEKLHEYGWHFNETTGVHFHLGVNKNIDFFYIIAMITLFYQKESFIFSNFPMRTKNKFAQSMENTIAIIRAHLLRIHASGGEETAVEMTDQELQEILDSLPKRQGTERYFGVNARPALTRHGTIELRYFHGQPLLDKPALLPRLIALFRSIMHEAQTSRYFAIPGKKDDQKLILERDAQDRVWIKTEFNRKANPNVRLPIVPKYIAPKGTSLVAHRPGIDSEAIRAKRLGKDKIPTIKSAILAKVLGKLEDHFFHGETLDANYLAKLRPILSEAYTFVDNDNMLVALLPRELLVKLQNVVHHAKYVATHNIVSNAGDEILRNLFDFLDKEVKIVV